VFKEGAVAYGEKDYWAESHASVNEEVEIFMIELPQDWTAQFPLKKAR
jgi:hypothetical protein